MSARDEQIFGDYLTAEISDHYTEKYGPESGERVRKALSADAAVMSPERLAEIRQRAVAATTGPWCTDGWEIYQGTEYLAGAVWIGETCDTSDTAKSVADAEFVAHSREDVPALLAEVDRLRAELAARPAEAHVLRQAAAALEEDDYLGAAAELLEMANQREHAAALRPWKDTSAKGESTRAVGMSPAEMDASGTGIYRCRCGHWDNVHGTACFAEDCDCGDFTYADGRGCSGGAAIDHDETGVCNHGDAQWPCATIVAAGAAPTAPELTVYRAQHDSIVMGLYTTATEARAHCVAEERRAWAKGEPLVFDWIEDEEDGVAELVVVHEDGDDETGTGYLVTALTVASAYDEEADE